LLLLLLLLPRRWENGQGAATTAQLVHMDMVIWPMITLFGSPLDALDGEMGGGVFREMRFARCWASKLRSQKGLTPTLICLQG